MSDILLESLEASIKNLSGGIARTDFYPSVIVGANADQIRRLIREWLVAKGMNERATLTASNTVLANAYRIGDNYIAKVNADDRGGRPTPKRRFGPNFLDVDIDFDAGTKELLGTALDGSVPEARAASKPSTGTSSPVINEAAIARAAAAVIGPRIETAKRELEAAIQSKVITATQELLLTPDSQAKITEIATSAATDKLVELVADIDAKHQAQLARIEGMIPQRIEVRLPNQPPRTLPAEPRHKAFSTILAALMAGEHVYLVGEAGTGKTFLFSQLGKALNQPTTILGQTLTKYEFSGHLGPTGEYVTTLLRHAVEEGHLLCIDEIDSSASAAIVFLNSLLANRFIAFPDKMVEAHPNFKVIAAANTFGFGATTQYIGRNPLDAASLDRFTYIECHYDEDLERQLYGDNAFTTYVHRVRAAVSKLELKHIISMRAIERGRRLLAAGMTPADVCRAALWRNLDTDTISRIETIAGKLGPADASRAA